MDSQELATAEPRTTKKGRPEISLGAAPVALMERGLRVDADRLGDCYRVRVLVA